MLNFVQELTTPALFCATVCFVALRAMAMIYAGAKPGPSDFRAPGHDIQTEQEFGGNRVQYIFDSDMTAHWNSHNGWLVLWVMRLGFLLSVLVALMGVVSFAL